MTNIFVGNLSFDTTDSDLQTTFSAYGAVERASVVRDRDSGQQTRMAMSNVSAFLAEKLGM